MSAPVLGDDATRAATERVATLFERLTPADVEALGRHYTEDAWFKDPFNEVRGLAAIQPIFRHMFAALESPRFMVTSRIAGAGECFLAWDFHFGLRGRALCIRGASHLRFAADGRVAWHRDYWDAAEELYEKLPVLGVLMRWLKRRAMKKAGLRARPVSSRDPGDQSALQIVKLTVASL